jgi:hypothetical protein
VHLVAADVLDFLVVWKQIVYFQRFRRVEPEREVHGVSVHNATESRQVAEFANPSGGAITRALHGAADWSNVHKPGLFAYCDEGRIWRLRWPTGDLQLHLFEGLEVVGVIRNHEKAAQLLVVEPDRRSVAILDRSGATEISSSTVPINTVAFDGVRTIAYLDTNNELTVHSILYDVPLLHCALARPTS